MEIPDNLRKLAEQSNSTKHEAEPYTLTPDEETEILKHEAGRLRDLRVWKLKTAGFTPFEISQKVMAINWLERVDRDAILKRANSNKNYQVWQTQQRQNEKAAELAKQNELRQRWTSENMFNHLKQASASVYGKELIINGDNEKLITTLCHFVSRDPRLQSELGLLPSRGLIIRGVSGLGKTHLVSCLEENQLNPILLLSMLEITEEIKRSGVFDLNLGAKTMIFLDDVGTEEPTVNYYGTKISFFREFIEMIYTKPGWFNKLIISTNFSFQYIEERYTFRVRSRMKEMFNVVDISGADMRGTIENQKP